MKPIKLKINTKTQEYSIIIGSNLVSNISKILKENSINFKQCLLITVSYTHLTLPTNYSV